MAVSNVSRSTFSNLPSFPAPHYHPHYVFIHICNIIISLAHLQFKMTWCDTIFQLKKVLRRKLFLFLFFWRESRFFPVRSHGWYKVLWYVTYITSAYVSLQTHPSSWRLLWHDMKILHSSLSAFFYHLSCRVVYI